MTSGGGLTVKFGTSGPTPGPRTGLLAEAFFFLTGLACAARLCRSTGFAAMSTFANDSA